MLGNSFGRLFKVTTCGESYSGAFRKNPETPSELFGGLMVIVDGVPSGLKLTSEMLQAELDKRRPGQSALDTPRQETDKAYIYSGVMENDFTTGAPVGIIIPNRDISDFQIEKHRSFKKYIRPGQAGYTYSVKYGEYSDWLGAGRASGRETVARVAAGAIAKEILDKKGIDVIAYTIESHGIKSKILTYSEAKENYRKNDINCPDLIAAENMIEDLLNVKAEGDTCGGIIEIIAKGVPAGLGEPVFDKLEALLSHALMSIGGVKGIEFGDGFELARVKGSQSNDLPSINENTGEINFKTNRAGGILGGISNGEELRIKVAVKPTPTISKTQDTVNLDTMENSSVSYTTRNDPSICPRIYPVCEAMVRLVILDALMLFKGYSI
jgi:chorismate synthase